MEPHDEFVSRSEVQEMIDAAIRRHNHSSFVIGVCISWVVLVLFVGGLLSFINEIPPLLPFLKITLN